MDNATFPNSNTLIPFDVETEDVEVDTHVAIPQMEPGSQQYLQVLFRRSPQEHQILYKVDDCVYLSVNDTRGPRVAQIKRLWRSPSGVLFFRGPVFVRPEETVHEPVRNFHFKEMIATQNEQNFQLGQIRGRCAVLVKPDYQACRPVTITEHHIYFQESKEGCIKIYF